MTLLHGTQIVTGMDGIRTSGTFANEGSHLNRAVGGGPIRGNYGGTAAGSAPFRRCTSRTSYSTAYGSGSASMRRLACARTGTPSGSAATRPSYRT